MARDGERSGTPRMTDFFGNQRAARRRTALLLVWFALALLAVVALVYVALALPSLLWTSGAPRFWSPRLLAVVAVAVLGTTAAGCAYHVVTLARGGAAAIVTALGATRLDPTSGVAAERRLLNVVEEMAVASGLPVPQVFVLRQEPAINALAAGAPATGAVVAVTAGALAQLSRDELQGVVAHEFSHLLNGDAVLNARLMGMLGGLTIIDLFGREALRLAWQVGRTARFAIVAIPVGLVLAAAGWFGVLCGQLVRCGVSRQREYLADAAAVQLTRNPGALASALAKVRDGGSALRHARAVEASHFFFGNAVGGALARWLATHPPVEERIRRLDPSALRPARAPAREPSAPTPRAAAARALVASIGAPRPAHLDRAAELLRTLPPAVSAAAHDPAAAGALVLALALAPDGPTRAAQLRWLGDRDGALAARAAPLADAVGALGREHRLVAVDVALSAIGAAPAAQRAAIRDEIAALPRAGGPPTVYEWMLRSVALRRLEAPPSAAGRPAVRFRAPSQVEVEALQLLSLIAWSGTRDPEAARAAVEAGARELGAQGWRPLPRESLDVAVADSALRQLGQAAPALQRTVLRACAAAAVTDDRITAPEAELLRATSAALGCPMPPVLPGAVSTDSVDSAEWRTAMPN